jgi:hypothetical protein
MLAHGARPCAGPPSRSAQLTQNRDDLAQSFKALGIGARLRLLEPGVATEIR